MGLKCRIQKSGKTTKVYNKNGTESKLYKDALELTGKERKALNIWAITTLPVFEESFGFRNNNDEVNLDMVLKFYRERRVTSDKLSLREMYEVRHFMKNNGIERLSELVQKMKPIFVTDGKAQLDTKMGVQSGLFLQEDFENIDIRATNDLLIKLEGQLLTGDFQVDLEQKDVQYRNPENKTIFGSSEVVSQTELEQELKRNVQDFSNRTEFDAAVSQLPYYEFIEKYQRDQNFADKFYGYFADLKKIQVSQIIDGQVVSGRTQTETTVRNTVPVGASTLSLEADISFLRGISPEIWEVSQEEVQAVLLEIEKELAEVGVDLVGLRDKFKNKEQILGLLESTKALLENPTNESIKNFADNYDTFFATLPQEEIIRAPNRLENFNLVKIYSSLGTEALFEQHGLIKVGDNLYHKVSNTDTTEDLVNFVAEQVIDNKVAIPLQFLNNVDTKDIESIRAAVEAFASSRDTGHGFQNKRMSLHQMAFNHDLQIKDHTRDLEGLAAFKSDEDYLRTAFVEDFYKLQLKEKLANSALYHNVLSKFAVLDNDIQLVGEFPDTSGLDIARNLVDYFRLAKNNSVKSNFRSSNAKADKSFIAVNFPNKIPEYSGQFKRAGEYLLTEPTAGVYIKVNGEVYAQVYYGTETNIYSELETNQDPNFYTTKVKYPYNEAEVLSLADAISIKELAQKSDTGTDKAEKAGFFSAFAKKVRERNNKGNRSIMSPAPAANVFEKNLVEFIRSKGVAVETDINRLQEVLNSFSVNPMMALEAYELMRITPQHEGQFENNTFTLHTSERKSKGQVLGIINNYAKRAKENLKNLYGRNFQDSFVMVNTGMWNSASITFRIPKNLRTEAEETASEQEQTAIEQETARQRERSILWEEIQRGVGREQLEDLGYNFLQTPLGEVLGFEYNGVIYLDESKLNNTTTIHELIHVYQAMIDIKAKQGDFHSQEIVSKRQEVFQEFADQWKAYHQGSQIESPDISFQTEAQQYFTREADRLPLTLSVFSNKAFKELQGKQVNPITVQQLLNQSGIKQIEKDLINQVIADNYQGQKKISYDELEATVRANIMPLERITTSSYADYGMDNLGDGRYGEAKTIILNAPIEHGVTGHFSGAFKASGRQNIKYIPKQLNDNTWVAVEEGYERQANDNNIYQYVGTAGTREAVDAWIENYKKGGNRPLTKENTKLVKDDSRYILLNDKNGPIIALDKEDVNVNRDDIHQAVLDNYYTAYPTDINKGMFGHIRVWQDGEVFNVAELQSDYFQKNNARKGILESRKDYKEAFDKKQKEEGYILQEREIYLKDEVHSDLLKIIEKNDRVTIKPHRLESYDGSFGEEALWLFVDDKPILVSKYSTEGYSEEMQRTGLLKGRNNLIALKEMLGEDFANNLQKEYDLKLKSFSDRVSKVNKEFEKNSQEIISKLSPQEKQFIASQKEWEKRMVREAIKEASLSGSTSLRFPTPYTLSVIEGYVSDNREETDLTNKQKGDIFEYNFGDRPMEVIVVSENEDEVKLWIVSDEDTTQTDSVEDFIEQYKDYTAEDNIELKENELTDYNGFTERYYYDTKRNVVYHNNYAPETIARNKIRQTEDSFQISELTDTQQTVTRKYEEIAQILKQERGQDNFQTVTDENGFDWYETKIKLEEKNSPVTAFQIAGEQGIANLDQIGFDLSSPAYAQRTGETDYAYNQRILKEVEAFMVAPEAAAKLEELQKQNSALWQKIMDFISEITKYLKTQLGLEDYRGNIAGMTRQQYSEALGVSVLKDEYTPNDFFSKYNVATRELQNQIRTENSGLELLIQPSEEMYNQIDGCS